MNFVALLDYIIDVARTLGISLFVVSSIAVILDKAQNGAQFRMIIVFLIVGIICVILGAILSTVYKKEE